LRYAVEIERVGSISRAAEKFYMNQPHLSKTIRELEETLGVVIFKRTPRGMVPTKRGLEFLAYAKSVLAQLDRIENLGGKDGFRKTAFNIAVPRASYIAYAFTEFIKTLPAGRALTVDYRETNSVSAARDVADGENGLGIVRFPVEYETYFVDFLREKDLNFESISRFEYLALFSAAHPLAGDESFDLSELEKYIEIVHGDTNIPSLSKGGRLFCGGEESKREIAVYERASQLELLKRVPLTYMWVSPMPEEVLSTFGLVQRRCGIPQKQQKDLLIYRNDHHFTDEDRGFILQLKTVVKEISFFQDEPKNREPVR
jgi:DNA-binding transcriptional LysR family regulator